MSASRSLRFGQPSCSHDRSHRYRRHGALGSVTGLARASFFEHERYAVLPLTSDRGRVCSRRRDSRRVIMASMAASITIHAVVLSVVIAPSTETSRHARTVPDFPGPRVKSNAPSGIRITRIVVAEAAARPATLEAAAAEPVAEVSEPDLEDSQASESGDPPPTPGLMPGIPSPTLAGEKRQTVGIRPATRLKPRFTNPMLWRKIPDPAIPSGVQIRARVEAAGSRYTSPDTWAFDAWATRDAAGRLWGAAPGGVYLAGFGMRTCGGRFDASNCGFGLPGWKRREYQHFLQAVTEIEEQQRWGGIMQRGRAIRERRGADRHPKTDSIPEV